MRKINLMRAVNIALWTVIVCFCAVVLFVGYRVFVCDRFIVPSDSMTPTLIPGDRILVNKLIFGARIYKNYDFSEGQPLKSWRMPGWRKIRTNDVLIFNAPFGRGWGNVAFKINYVFSKRCIGTPGDTVSIEGGFYRNNHFAGVIGSASQQSRFAATPDEAIPEMILNTMPFDGRWNAKEFGPLYVPARGDTLLLDEFSRPLYGSIIEYETGRQALDDEYVFRQNYYFVGGDNVFDSGDSRYWGFVPEEFIIGVARRIAYSRDRQTDEFRWNRIMRKIDLEN